MLLYKQYNFERQLLNDVNIMHTNLLTVKSIVPKIEFKIPTYNSQNNLLFRIDRHRHNYSYHSSLKRTRVFCNKLTNFDFFMIHRVHHNFYQRSNVFRCTSMCFATFARLRRN